MTVEWIVPLRKMLDRMHQHYQVLLQNCPEMYMYRVEALGNKLQRPREWAQILSFDETLWTWIRVSDMYHTSNQPIHQILLICKELKSDIEEDEGADASLLPVISALSNKARAVRTLINKHLGPQDWRWFSQDSPLEHVPPVGVVNVCLSVTFDIVLHPVDLPADVLHWPAVVYHPFYNYFLLWILIASLHRITQRSISIGLTRTVVCLEIEFTVQGLNLTPALWETLISMVMVNYEIEYEFLYEMGGSIEPLVWHDELGDGVIVRLPWAR